MLRSESRRGCSWVLVSLLLEEKNLQKVHLHLPSCNDTGPFAINGIFSEKFIEVS